MAEEKSPQQLVKESIWTAASRIVVLAAVFGAGFYVGYLKWGDAPQLEKKVKVLKDQVVMLRNEREEIKSTQALLQRDLEDAEEKLATCKEDLETSQAPKAEDEEE